MIHGSLFTGIGGFDLGFERAGMRTAWQCETDRFCNQVLAARWPEVTRYEDIRELDPTQLAPVDLVSGGFPCQDLSVAGRRAGLAGARSGLWGEFERILRGARPRWCVVENVPGLLTAGGGADFECVLSALDELGYFVEWATLDSQHFGVPQRRRRVFLVGHLGGPPRRPVLLDPASLCGDPPPRREAGEGAARASAFSAGNSGDAYGIGYTEEGTPPLRSSESGTNQVPTVSYCLNARSGGASAKEQQETFVVSKAVSCHQAKGGDPTMDNYLPDGCAVRRLTPLECERLQGFPDGWTALDGAKDTPRYRALGNAVTVTVAEWIARRLLEASA